MGWYARARATITISEEALLHRLLPAPPDAAPDAPIDVEARDVDRDDVAHPAPGDAPPEETD